ncbi:hypothetical protein FHS41_002045 [Streptomyces violarus]|uniref:Uncharacterized protein n=1 Tax=Streptomyces violarus TaxID=67380 RepID=A0A7W4ZNG3_9ACTN|nr:hypothetical protein [Streptomyces violarus]
MNRIRLRSKSSEQRTEDRSDRSDLACCPIGLKIGANRDNHADGQLDDRRLGRTHGVSRSRRPEGSPTNAQARLRRDRRARRRAFGHGLGVFRQGPPGAPGTGCGAPAGPWACRVRVRGQAPTGSGGPVHRGRRPKGRAGPRPVSGSTLSASAGNPADARGRVKRSARTLSASGPSGPVVRRPPVNAPRARCRSARGGGDCDGDTATDCDAEGFRVGVGDRPGGGGETECA